MPFIAIALAVAATLGGGTAFVAQQSLPGDALWGFKVSVNERVQAALHTSTEAKAEWDVTIIEKRLMEARTLAAEGKLTTTLEAKILANLETHADRVEEQVMRFQAEGDAFLAANIAASLQEAMLQGASAIAEASAIVQTAGGSTTAIEALQRNVGQRLQSATTLSTSASANASLDTSVSSDGSINTNSQNSGNAGVEVQLDGTLDL